MMVGEGRSSAWRFGTSWSEGNRKRRRRRKKDMTGSTAHPGGVVSVWPHQGAVVSVPLQGGVVSGCPPKGVCGLRG